MNVVVNTQSAIGDDERLAAEIDFQEHQTNLRRLRVLFTVSVAAWLLVVIPNDVFLARRLLPELVACRVAGLCVLLLGLYVVRRQPPDARGLFALEIAALATVSASQGLVAMSQRGLSSTMTFLTCALLLQGLTVPRRARQGAVALGVTWLAFPAAMLALGLSNPKLRGQLSDPARLAVFAQMLGTTLSAYLILVAGGHTVWRLRRQVWQARKVGVYQLTERLGSSGSSEVWRAWHPDLKREVALKLLRGHRVSGEALRRFGQEVETLSKLSHPNSVRVLDRGVSEDGLAFFAMELVLGETLTSLVARGPLSPARASYLLVQAARAVAEAHALRLVHRDLKPDNLLVATIGGEHDVVKVVDFGRAAVRGDASPAAGSLGFVAPEQAAAASPDPRADVFGLGAVLYFALVGKGPFETEGGVTAAARAGVTARPPEMVVDAEVWSVVERCLRWAPEERYADAGEVAVALAACSVAAKWSY